MTSITPKTWLSTALVLLGLCFFTSSCHYYRQDFMFQTDSSRNWIEASKVSAEKSYRIQKYDLMEIQVYVNKGEMLLGPSVDAIRQLGGNAGTTSGAISSPNGGGAGGGGAVNNPGAIESTTQFGRFQVDGDGMLILPLIGKIKVEGLTYEEADNALAKAYAVYYEEPFVMARIANRRVFFLTGMLGQGGMAGAMMMGVSRVVALQHDRTHLFEVLASTGGIQAFANASKIRIIRGDLRNPSIQVVNLTTVEAIMAADLIVQPNDIIYVEPGRRPGVEAFRDYAPVVTTFLGIFSITLSTIVAVRAFR